MSIIRIHQREKTLEFKYGSSVLVIKRPSLPYTTRVVLEHTSLNPDTGNEETDMLAVAYDMMKHCIVDWSGIEDATPDPKTGKHEEIPFDPDLVADMIDYPADREFIQALEKFIIPLVPTATKTKSKKVKGELGN